MALGQILREARISRGYTESEVAERIKMNPQMLVDIEMENYSRIAALIYGKGYVRKYAEFLGLDYRPLVEEFKNAFGSDKIEKPTVPLEGFDPENGMLKKVVPPNMPRSSSEKQQIITTSEVKPLTNSDNVQIQDKNSSFLSNQTSENSLFSEFDTKEETVQSNQQVKTEEKAEEIFVPAHLATTPPTASIPPANTIPDSVAQSKYTFSPEKFTPRTTMFKPDKLPSIEAPEPIPMSVTPFSYPEPNLVDDVRSENSRSGNISELDDEESLFSPKSVSKGPILSKYLGQNGDVEPTSIYEKQSEKKQTKVKDNSPSFVKIFFSKLCANFKDLFVNNPNEDITEALARKQRRLGLGFAFVIVIILIVVFSINKNESTTEDKITTDNVVENEINNLPSLVDDTKDEDKNIDTLEVEVVQILPTPKGFID